MHEIWSGKAYVKYRTLFLLMQKEYHNSERTAYCVLNTGNTMKFFDVYFLTFYT